MIVTIFVAGADETAQQRAEIHEYAWLHARQGGEILRLMPAAVQTPPPLHARCRVEAVLPWSRHPYIDDEYAGYDLPASLLEFLVREELDATVLLLDERCLQKTALERELSPGQAAARRWPDFPRGDGPFGLSAAYGSLAQFCVNRQLALPEIRLPLLMHAQTLRRIAARWLELTGIIRLEVRDGASPPEDAVDIALNIACAEYGIEISSEEIDAAVLRADDAAAAFDAHHSMLSGKRASGEWLQEMVPVPRPGVRQGRVLDQVYLESGWPLHASRLNSSAAAIWLRCDGSNSLWSIAQELHAQYQVPLATMVRDVMQAALQLQAQAAITLETTH